MAHNPFFGVPAGSDFFESEEPPILESSSAQAFQPFKYPDHNVQEHCQDCCIDPRCLLNNCAECSERDEDCQQCLEECTDDCAKDKSFVVDCNGSGCSYFDSFFASEPCTEPCQSQVAECNGCHTQIPLGFSLDPCFDQCQPDRPKASHQAGTSFQNNDFYSSSDADGVGHSLDAPGDFNVLYTPTVNDALNEPSTSNPYSFTPVPLNQDRAWHSQIPFKTPPPSLAPTLPKRSRSKRPQPLAITSSPQTTTATTANTATTTTTDTSAASFAKTHTPTSSAAATTASLTPAPATHTCLWLDDDEHPCNQTFPDPAALHSHLKTAHTVDEHHFCRWQGCHTGIHSPAPHRFVHGALRHTWGHSHYRPYVCSVCNRGFAAANVLAEHHESAHLGRKAFTCAHCGYACSSASNLKRHVAERHARARFQCEWCARKGTVRCFRRGPNLARHFRKCSNVLRACGKVVGPGGEMDAEWFPPGYWKGKNGMDRGKVIPPDHLGADFAPPAGMDREMR